MSYRPRAPPSAFADQDTWEDAILVVDRAHGRPRTASAARSVSSTDAFTLQHCVPRRSVNEVGKIIRLEAAPFGLRRDEIASRRCVSLRGKAIDSVSSALLATAVASGALRHCVDLDLAENAMGDEGVEALSLALGAGAMAYLTSLALGSNQIGDAGAMHLANALDRGAVRRLEGLYLPRNHIGDEGVRKIASSCSAERGLTSLCFLQLSHNRFADEGLIALATAAAERGAWPKLERLWINHNAYAADGSRALARAIGALPALRDLRMDDMERIGVAVTGMVSACALHGVSLAAGRVIQLEKSVPKRFRGGGKLKV